METKKIMLCYNKYMAIMDIGFVEKYKQEEHTGENRCKPCTILNIVLAGLFSFVAARKSRIGGYVMLVVSLELIYLRGYLVPGTPTLTKRYLSAEVLRWFGKDPELETQSGLGSTDNSIPTATTSDSQKTGEEIDPHNYLIGEGILEPCENQQDLCLVDSFKQIWSSEIDDMANTDIELDANEAASELGVKADAEEFVIEQYGEARTLVVNSQTVGQWPSQSALLADISAAHVLSKWSNHWDVLTTEQKGQILNGLRLFLEDCPGKTGSVSMNQETVESCCSSHEVITISCDETGDRLFEQPLNEA